MKTITSQEMKILELIGEGLTTSQIARDLAISSHTVESHRKSLLLKLYAKNAAELIRQAIQQNLIPVNNSTTQSHRFEF